MTKADKRSRTKTVAVRSLEAMLLERYGLVMGPAQIREALSFPSAEALRVALLRGKVGVGTFAITGRRGRFALTVEVAEFLEEQQRNSSVAPLTAMEKSQTQND